MPFAGVEVAPGAVLVKGWLDKTAQRALLEQVRAVLAEAPLYKPRMPRSGAPLSVLMTNCGALGWMTDAERGYRYEAAHPQTGRRWPPIPELALRAWREIARWPTEPEACLVNWYDAAAKMGLHQDRDEANLAAPVLSISLGDEAVFRLGGTDRRAPTKSIRLASGDVLTLGGPSRLAFHGIDRIIPNSSRLLEEGGRFNLTLRRVNPSPANPRQSSGP
jgi:DNA oxidative demethylase